MPAGYVTMCVESHDQIEFIRNIILSIYLESENFIAKYVYIHKEFILVKTYLGYLSIYLSILNFIYISVRSRELFN